MHTVTLGSTSITVNKNAFGALPIQRVSDDYAVMLLKKAYDGGVRFFDTARMYTDSEHKLNLAFSHMREKVFISTKTGATTVEDFWKDLEISLGYLGYIDIYQFHNPAFCPKPGDGTGLYEAMLQAKAEGKIRHIGITNHRLSVAKEAIESGLYETLQFPFCYLATEPDLEISLGYLGYIDIYQFHNPSFCPKPGDGTGLYEAMLQAKAQGKIRHIGITNHRLSVAK